VVRKRREKEERRREDSAQYLLKLLAFVVALMNAIHELISAARDDRLLLLVQLLQAFLRAVQVRLERTVLEISCYVTRQL
jgi:hypothetical protein